MLVKEKLLNGSKSFGLDTIKCDQLHAKKSRKTEFRPSVFPPEKPSTNSCSNFSFMACAFADRDFCSFYRADCNSFRAAAFFIALTDGHPTSESHLSERSGYYSSFQHQRVSISTSAIHTVH